MKSLRKFLVSKEYKEVIKDLLLVSEDIVQKQQKDLSHLRFARPTKSGWSFFKKKTIPWETLEEISHTVAAKHPHCGKSLVAHLLSEIVNLTKKDDLLLRTLL